MKIVVHVDRLVLDGVGTEPHDAPRIRAAVERELTRLFAGTAHARFAAGAVPRIAAPDVAHAAAEPPERTGAHIAAAVHAGIVRSA